MKIVEFETAIKLKELGFDLPTDYYFDDRKELGKEWSVSYQNSDFLKVGNSSPKNKTLLKFCSAPTQSELQTWLRDVHKIDLNVARDGEYGHSDNAITESSKYDWLIQNLYAPATRGNLESDTYEEALEVGLQEALKRITNE